MLQGNDLGDHFVFRRGDAVRERPRRQALFPRNLCGDDLDHVSRRDGGESVDFQDRFEDPVDFADGDFFGGDDGHLALDPFVEDEILPGQLADELDEDLDVHIVEIDGDIPGAPAGVSRRCPPDRLFRP